MLSRYLCEKGCKAGADIAYEELKLDAATILDTILKKYQGSNDFNGWPAHAIQSPAEKSALVGLIEAGLVDLINDEETNNPHIRLLPARPISDQVKRVSNKGLKFGCLFPTQKALVEIAGVSPDPAAPYTAALKLGAPQLEFRTFRLEVLERYRNDPTFRYSVDDTSGTIYRNSKDKESHEYAQFGFAFDENVNRYVAAFLRYLHDMSAEQQAYWAGFELQGDFKLHPDYYRSSILGEWPEGVSVFDAILEEKKIINIMSERMGKPRLFKSDYEAYRRPDHFGFLIRPTKKEFSDFCLRLDQLMSDDMNYKFFEGDIEVYEYGKMDSGEEIKRMKGTISLLMQWLAAKFKPKDEKDMVPINEGFRAVRKARQKPAHKIEDNVFDEAYYQQQRELMIAAYGAVRFLRQVFANHPACKEVEVPKWLFEGHIWTQ
ncbi:hypothetical protein AMC87_CH02903 [Rhizobium phaseoli]|nr:hypothetical protein AMC87_CH02903 [Rhizobium phaseoli]